MARAIQNTPENLKVTSTDPDRFNNRSTDDLLDEIARNTTTARESNEWARHLRRENGFMLVAVWKRIGNDLFEQVRLKGVDARDARRMMRLAGWIDPHTPARTPNALLLFNRFRETWPTMSDTERGQFARLFFEVAWPTLTPDVQKQHRTPRGGRHAVD